MSFDAKIKEYLRRKNIEKNGLFNDEIDIGGDYYQDFDYEENVEDRDNSNFYDYSDFIANSDPGLYRGKHQASQIKLVQPIKVQPHFFTISTDIFLLIIDR